MHCLYSSSLIAVLAVILCTVGTEGLHKRQAFGPCNMNQPSTQPMPGHFVPKCTKLGLFEIIQTNPSTGYQWCVNPITGEKQEGSDVAPGVLGTLFAKPKCGPCLYALNKYHTTVTMFGIGGHAPECDAKGLYSATQSSGGTGYSWCVNPETGETIKGSEVAPGAGKANCEGRQKRQTAYGPCNMNEPSTSPMPGQFVFKCTEWGLFEIIQSNPSTGYKWCVNPLTGVKVEGSDVKPGLLSFLSKPKCGKCLYDLNTQTVNTAMWGIGGHQPQCDANGQYNAMQTDGGTGYSWCVNTENGAVIKGSEVKPGAGQAKC